MSLLNSKFDLLRGYPNGSALVWPFMIKKTGSPLAPVTIAGGKLVTQELQGTNTVVNLASTPALDTQDPIDVWLVVEGNDDYSGEFVEKCNTVKVGSGIIWETDDYEAGSYTVGQAVSFSSGQIMPKDTNEQIIGYVLEDRTATKGTLVISA